MSLLAARRGSIARAASPSAGGGTYEDEVLADSPVGYWKLDETSGTTATDSSGNGRDGAYNGTVTLNARTVGSFAAPDFGGGYVNIADNSAFSAVGSTGTLTVEAWVLVDSLTNAEMLVTKGANNNFEWRFNTHTDGGIYWVITTIPNTSEQSMSVASAVSTASAMHLAITHDKGSGESKFYKNGSQIGTTKTPTVTMSDGTAPVQIGRRADGGGTTIDGAVCQVAIYPTALSAARIAAHYAAA